MLKTAWFVKNLKKSREELETIQWKMLKETISYAYNNTKFYKEKFDKAGIKPNDIKSPEDLLKIPVTYKREIQENYKDMIAKGYKEEDMIKTNSSGSMGRPVTIFYDKKADYYLTKVIKLRSKKFCGLKLKDRVINVEDYTFFDMEKKNTLFKKAVGMKYVTNRIGIPKIIQEIKDFKATVLYSRPSDLFEYSKYILENNIQLPRIRMIFSSGEHLLDNERKQIEKAFGCKIFNIYGNSESKEVAWECNEHKGFHINLDSVYLEFIKHDGEIAKEGEEGNLIVSSLILRGMPLIRYSPDDFASYSKRKCSCGCEFPLIERVIGRKTDYFYLRSGKITAPHVIIKAIRMNTIDEILQLQAIQKTYEEITINIVPSKLYSKETNKKIIADLKKVLDNSIKVKINLVDDIPKEKNGKYRVVKTEVKR